ncbi:MAG TPA: tyrosine-type recombinase/integrase [Ignavibacteriaceae bacterium]|nr:tyrosine-type recombinase/integrase [Ignavibacteriaceae bacterium]
MNIHFYLERKELKSPERAIYCYIRGLAKGKTIQLNTKHKITHEHWDKSLELAIEKGKNKYPLAKELNSYLNSYKDEIKKTVLKIQAANPTTDYEEIRSVILEKFGKFQKEQLNLFQALEIFKDVRKKDMSPDSIRKYGTVIKHLKGFEKKNRVALNFAKLDLMFYDKFLTYLLEDDGNEKKAMVNNSAYKIIGLFKIFLNWAYERNINTYSYYKKWKVKEDKIEVIALTERELKKLYAMEFDEKNKHLKRAMDLFLFGCYTGGRFGDLARIEHQDIRNNKWFLRTGKTRDVLEIPLNDYAISILAKYSHLPTPLPRLSNQKLNQYIKEICATAEINDIIKTVRYRGNKPEVKEFHKWQLVTVHTARRTFITQSLMRGIKAEVIMSISGHQNYKTFKKYIDITSREKENAIKSAWNEEGNVKVFNI